MPHHIDQAPPNLHPFPRLHISRASGDHSNHHQHQAPTHKRQLLPTLLSMRELNPKSPKAIKKISIEKKMAEQPATLLVHQSTLLKPNPFDLKVTPASKSYRGTHSSIIKIGNLKTKHSTTTKATTLRKRHTQRNPNKTRREIETNFELNHTFFFIIYVLF